jgi:hypothetical protein
LGLGSKNLGPLLMPLTLWVSENWLARKLAEQALWGPSLIRTGAINVPELVA